MGRRREAGLLAFARVSWKSGFGCFWLEEGVEKVVVVMI